MIKIIGSTYELKEEIGSGGGGRVYLAVHKRLHKEVILKADKRNLKTREDLLRREVDVLKNLSNPYIPQVYDYFAEDGVVYTAMEYIDGESLDKPLKRGEHFPQSTVIKWAIQLLSALEYLHEPVHGNPPRGYVHSDIKPSNLMKRLNGDISLIDFNIALALGEEHAVGGSAGYASPEHYGLDYSSSGSMSSDDNLTETEVADDLATETDDSSGVHKKIMPDVRSDIYSVGATLYHLLSGIRPAKNALDIVPLSKKEQSPELVKIIMKSLNPNPDLRYQSAAEMLYAIRHIRESDARYKRLKYLTYTTSTFFIALFVIGTISSFIFLHRIQVNDRWKLLTNYAQQYYEEGDVKKAKEYINKVYNDKKLFIDPDYPPKSQEILSEILGVYDFQEDFKRFGIIELKKEPHEILISPDEETLACFQQGLIDIYELPSLLKIDTINADVTVTAEMEYLDEDNIVYAGEEGLSMYKISQKKDIWVGKPSTLLSVSDDGERIAGVYKNEDFATIYNTNNGEVVCTVDFRGRHIDNEINDNYLNSHNCIFELNEDGSLLAISFEDGSLSILKVDENAEGEDIEIFGDDSGFNHFEGGFANKYFACAATGIEHGENKSVFFIFDTESYYQNIGVSSEYYISASVSNGRIFACDGNYLVELDPNTGEQFPLTDSSHNIKRFTSKNGKTLISVGKEIEVFDTDLSRIGTFKNSSSCDMLDICNDYLVLGSNNSTKIVVMRRNYNNSDTYGISYDSQYVHDETRYDSVSDTYMLFSTLGFRIYGSQGNLITNFEFSDSGDIYDQQYIRNENATYLQVTYLNGRIDKYSAATGELTKSETGPVPDNSLNETLVTENFIFEAPIHGYAHVYSAKSNKSICDIKEDADLSYATELETGIVLQFITTEGEYYGVLYDADFEPIARLPGLKDVFDGTFLFDYGNGKVFSCKCFSQEELLYLLNEQEAGN